MTWSYPGFEEPNVERIGLDRDERLKGYAIAVIPRSWGFGVWRRPHKVAFALGPFRVIRYIALKPWRSYDGPPRN